MSKLYNRVVIVVADGMVTGVLADNPDLKCIVIDYDVDGDDHQEGFYQIPQGALNAKQKRTEPANIYEEEIETNPDRIDYILKEYEDEY